MVMFLSGLPNISSLVTVSLRVRLVAKRPSRDLGERECADGEELWEQVGTLMPT